MIFKTLHWYILREMLRIFLMTAGALTTLMAFGGTFQPLVKEGIEISQLMTIMFNLMPAMLAYAIPISALFAAVLVYWRMATDNELTACRAGGISFVTVIIPAFLLGLAVASTDLVFVNYVVPHYLQAAERSIRRDLGSIMVAQVGRGEYFDYDRLIVYANSATQSPGHKPGESIVTLEGVAGTALGSDGKPTRIVVARQATVTITDLPAADSAEIDIQVTDAAAYDPKTFGKISGSVSSFAPEGHKFIVPSQLKTKPKFLNIKDLSDLNDDPYKFPSVRDAVNRLGQALRFEDVADHLFAQWAAAGADKALEFDVQSPTDPAAHEQLRVLGPRAQLTTERTFLLTADAARPVRVEQLRNGALLNTYTCDAAEMQLASDEFLGSGVTGILQLRGHVMQLGHKLAIEARPVGAIPLSGIAIPPAFYARTAALDPVAIVARAEAEVATNPALTTPLNQALRSTGKLFQYIRSELHSRGSFALACLTLVLLGAALGILMRGKNPLAVFVVGFVPAIVLVLLITAGRQLTEGDPRNALIGISTIWLGNLILLVMVSIVYGKLLRQ